MWIKTHELESKQPKKKWTSKEEGDAMCRPVTCKICGKITWAGCGEHIEAVKAQVSPEQWCDGKHRIPAVKSAAERN